MTSKQEPSLAEVHGKCSISSSKDKGSTLCLRMLLKTSWTPFESTMFMEKSYSAPLMSTNASLTAKLGNYEKSLNDSTSFLLPQSKMEMLLAEAIIASTLKNIIESFWWLCWPCRTLQYFLCVQIYNPEPHTQCSFKSINSSVYWYQRIKKYAMNF